ncbi:hypothetical protein M422DRAFT_40818 [Sphaerobolus stellatus SS14]|nr:hypothetical protein M422DRAFT_40818 [Sphaerobolus stellatus SS14]
MQSILVEKALHSAKETNSSLESLINEVEVLKLTVRLIWKQNHQLSMWVACFLKQKEGAVSRAAAKEQDVRTHLNLKENGVIPDLIQDLILHLVAEGVGRMHIEPVIMAMIETLGIEGVGHISPRSISRSILEGGIAGDLLVVEKMAAANSRLSRFQIK